MINCPLCNRDFRCITNSHVKKEHSMTMEEFSKVTGLKTFSSNEYWEGRVKDYNLEVFNSPHLGVLPDDEVARIYSVSRRTVARLRGKKGLLPPTAEYLSYEGLYLRSSLEAMYDAYLHELGVEHEHEPVPVPTSKYRADFKVGNVFIEIRGMENYKEYDLKQTIKDALYKRHNLKVVSLLPPAIHRMYNNCKVNSIIFTGNKKCKECNENSASLSLGYCSSCYSRCHKPYTKTCPGCGKEFQCHTNKQLFCGRECSTTNQRKAITLKVKLFDEILNLAEALALYNPGLSLADYRFRIRAGWTPYEALAIQKGLIKIAKYREDNAFLYSFCRPPLDTLVDIEV